MPETPDVIRGLAATMVTKFTPPSFVPGCKVASIADADEYTTDNGWIEAIVGGDNQQRVRYYGTPQGVAVDDYVDVEYFPAYKLYRVFGSTLGGTASVGGLRVNKIWDSDFQNVAMEAGTVNLTINGTRTLTVPTDIIHAGDADTFLSFPAADQWGVTVGSINMILATETAQNVLALGDVAGTGDVDVKINNGQMILQGSNGFLAVGTAISGVSKVKILYEIGDIPSANNAMEVQASWTPTANDATRTARGLLFTSAKFGAFDITGNLGIRGTQGAAQNWGTGAVREAVGVTSIVQNLETGVISNAFAFYAFGPTVDLTHPITNAYALYLAAQSKSGVTNGYGVYQVSSSDVNYFAGVIESSEITTPAAGAANRARLFSRDDGDGNTEYCIRFSSGLVQVIAPLQFGEISRTGNTTLTALTVSTPAQYLFFDTNGPSNGATSDHTNDHVTVGKTGTYLIVVSLSAESVAGSAYDIEFTVLKNNGATQVGELHAHRSFAGGGGDFGSISLSGLAVLTAADTIEVWLENQTSSQDLRIEDATLSITMVGVNA